MTMRRSGRLGAALTQRFGLLSGVQSMFAAQPTPPPVQASLNLPHGERTYTMFVQTARSGTWTEKPDEEGVYTLTLTGLPAQTVYFSDRPDRMVGTQTTSEFLAALGFVDENPPNAALVTTTDAGQDILVIELFNPIYTEGADASGATLTYDARILESYHETRLGGVAELQSDPVTIPASFDGASLFIDDCADGQIWCGKWRKVGPGDYHLDQVSDTFSFGCCWHYFPPGCMPCNSIDDSYCTSNVAECSSGDCILHGNYCGMW